MQGLAGRSVGQSVESSAADELARQSLLATGTDGPEPFPASAALRDSGPTLFDSSASLREAAAARVAAHRNRRAGAQAMNAARDEALRSQQLEDRARVEHARRGASHVRDTVRARYEHSQSYRDFLAAEAERATQQARAEAEIAARNARAIADAQLQLLEELRQQEDAPAEFAAPHQHSVISTEEFEPSSRAERASAQPRDLHFASAPHQDSVISTGAPSAERRDLHFGSPQTHQPASGDLFAEPEITEITTGGLTVRLFDDLGPATPSLSTISPARRILADPAFSLDELEGLDQEIAFRRAPEFIDHIIETMPLPANLIEFPRELVATRKARPRLAEGPLREELPAEPQLRIFEVEPETISTEPAAHDNIDELTAGAPVWQGLLLDTPRMSAARAQHEANPAASLADIAPVSRRLMAAAVDACCIGAAFTAFATTVSYISGPRLQALSHPGSRPMLAGAVVITLAISTLLYQLLFFSLNEATPGMRYARIGLCTFADANPTRRALRRRVLATVLAACPLGLGLLWACLDDDRLGWHDRISRMYHRSY